MSSSIIKINFIQKKSVKTFLWKTLNIFVGVSTIINVSMVGALIPLNVAQADTPVPSGTIAATYHPADGSLSVSGQYSWTPCNQSNNNRIVGVALFVDGPDADALVGNPQTANDEALDGTGMHLPNGLNPCTTTPGSWSDNSHNAQTDPVLATAPTKVCVVGYDVRDGDTSGSHSQIGAGANHNSDNSFHENHDAYATGACTTPTTEPPTTPGVCPIFGIQDQNTIDSIFFKLNPADSQKSQINPTRPGYDIEAMDSHPDTDVMYGMSGDQNDPAEKKKLLVLDPTTGIPDLSTGVPLGIGSNQEIQGASFNPITKELWIGGDGDLDLRTLNISTGATTPKKSVSGSPESLAWKPDGSLLYYSIVGDLQSYNPSNGNVSTVCPNLGSEIEGMEYDDVGNLLVMFHGDTKIYAVNPTTCSKSQLYDVAPYNDVETLTYACPQPKGTLKVIKQVSGSSEPSSSWQMHVKTSSGSEVSGSPQPGSTTGTTYTLAPATYVVSETDGPSGYTMSFSGDCNSSGQVNVTDGSSKVCTVTNTKVQETRCNLTLTKSVQNLTHPEGPNRPGDVLKYTLNYANTGNANCTGGGVRIDDTLATGMTYNGNHTQAVNGIDPDGQGITFGYSHLLFGPANPSGYDAARRLLSWDAERVSPGESGTVTFQTTIDALDQCATRDLRNKGKIYADQIPSGIWSNEVTTHVEALCAGSISGVKFNDLNGNGQRDNGEPGLNNWTIQLDAGANGSVDATTTTNSSGAFSFGNLSAGTYRLREVQQSGWQQTTANPADITLALGQNASGVLFGNQQRPTTLTVIKRVVGSDAAPSSWSIHVKQNGTEVSGSPQPGNASGTTYTLSAGTYNVSETGGPAGYTLSYSGDCNANGTVQLATAEQKTCTLTNTRDTGIVKVDKKVDANSDGTFEGGNDVANALGFRWSLDNGAVNRSMGSSANATTGNHSVTENSVNGYHFVGWYAYQFEVPSPLGSEQSEPIVNNDNGPQRIPADDELQTGFSCANPQSTTLPVTISVTKGFTTHIVLCNARDTGSLKVNKEFDDDGDDDVDRTNPNGWNWDIAGGAQNNPGGATRTVVAGTHTISEDPITNYRSAWSCSNQTSGNGTSLNVSVAKDQLTTCTFRNTRDTGSIVVNKKVDSDGNGTFEGGNTEANTLGFRWGLDNGAVDRTMGSTASGVFSGNHTVTENSINNYQFVGWYQNGSQEFSCTNPQSTTLPVTVNVTKNQTVSITLCNALGTGSVKVDKKVDSDGNGTFEGGNSEANTLGFRWGLDNGAVDRSMGSTANAVSGNHTVTENSVNGYHFVGWYPTASTAFSCANPQSTTLPANIAVTTGQTTSITLCNARDTGSLKVNKEFDDDGDGDVDRTNPNGWNWDVIGGPQNNPGGSIKTLVAGTHVVTEDAIAQYSERWSCSDDTSGNGTSFSVSIPKDQLITCTFRNTRETGRIEGVKFNDLNGNGQRDEGEPGVPGITIQLSNGGTSSTQTNESGHYAFELVATGTYIVTEVLASGWINTTPNPVTGVIVNANQTTTVNFGNFQKITLSGQKFNDLNGNGSKDENEPGLANWTINLDVGANGSVDGSLPTDENGNYSFANLGPGTYRVREVQQTGWQQTTADPADIVAQSGTNVSGVNFGNREEVSPDLIVTKTDGLTTANPRQILTYTMVVSNIGGAPAANSAATDTLPAQATYVSSTLDGVNAPATVTPNPAGDMLTWNLGTLNPGASKTIQVTVQLDSTFPFGTTDLINTVTVSTTTNEPNTSNNTARDTTSVSASPTINFDKSGPVTTGPGSEISYSLAWSVGGNAVATNAIITDAIPANTVFESASCGTTLGTCTVNTATSPITWNLGTRNPGESGTVTMTVNVVTPLANNTEIVNTGTFDTTENEPVSDSVTTVVQSSSQLSLAKSDSPDPVSPGGSLTYVLTWSVSGSSPLTNVVLTDTLPTEVTFVSASAGGNHNGTNPGGVVTWNLGTKAPGDNGTVTINVTASNSLGNGAVFTNSGSIDSAETGPTTATATTTVTAKPILGIVKSVNLVFANPGDTVTYSVVITNSGNDKAVNVTLTDTLPTGFTFVEGGSSTKTFQLGTLEKGQSMTKTYEVKVSASQGAGTYNNFAVTKADNHGPVSDEAPLEIRAPIVLAAEQVPALSLEKTASKSVLNPGDTLTYIITIANNGNGTAKNVRLDDTLPGGFTYKDTGSDKRVWTIGDLAGGEIRTITYEVKVGDTVKAGTYTNVVIARADNHDAVKDSVPVEVRVPKVLAAPLAETGAGPSDYLFFAAGLLLMSLGFLGFRQARRLSA